MKKKLIIFIGIFCVVSASFFSRNLGLSRKEVEYNGSNLMVNVDGVSVDKLPTSGSYYLASYDCKSSNTVVTWDKENYKLSISNGSKRAGVSCYLEFKTHPSLSEMSIGSYVSYNGNNGCVGDSCSGVDNGSCSSSKFSHKGFRIAYISDGTYLVSAGALDCSNQNDINRKVLGYCNSNYVYGGSCDNSNVRNINGDDFNTIVNQGLDMVSCYDKQDKKCGYTNDLIDIGGDYWFSSLYQDNASFYWSSVRRSVIDKLNNSSLSIRPVVRIDDSVIVVSGSGTEEDPYKIANNNFVIGKYNTEDKSISLKMIGYQVKEMCVNLNSTVCTNYEQFQENYVLDVSKAKEDNNVIYVYYKDYDGNIVHTINKEFSLKNV